jgi:hypothetical protein
MKNILYTLQYITPTTKNEKNVSSLAHLFYQFAYILTRRGGGEVGWGWGMVGVDGSSIISWGVFFLLRHMQKKHTTNTAKTHS